MALPLARVYPDLIFARPIDKKNLMKAVVTVFFAFVSLIMASGQNLSISSSREGNQRITYNRGGMSSFNVETRGKMEITDDDKDIKSMSPDGYLEINKTVFGSKRTIVISPQGNGLKKEYYEGRTLMPFEPDGRKWLGEILPEIVRSTHIAAESRVKRFFNKGGSGAVLDEIKLIESDYVKVHYANLLLEQNVQASELSTIVNSVTGGMDSDHYITEFLTKNIRRLMVSKDAADAVYAATRNMDSDHYKTQVIKEALREGPASPESVKSALLATSNMSSDHYKTEVLTSLLRQNNLTENVVSEMIGVTKSMDSDHYKTVILTRALSKQGLSSTSFQKILEAVKEMDSDHYKTEVMTHLLENNVGPDLQTILIAATSSIDSDHYISVVGKKILKNQNLTDEAFQNLLQVMASNQSDYYMSEFLKTAADRPGLSKQNIQTILNAVGSIDSDHYMTEVLVDLAPSLRALNDQSLKDAYRAAAKKIGSETYYGRALRAID